MTLAGDHRRRLRWRLVLGRGADQLGQLPAGLQSVDDALGFLYDREYEGRNERGSAGGGGSGDGRTGGLGGSELTVPEWINQVHTLFPAEAIERLESDALERYRIEEMITRRDVLERVEPSPALLKAVLATKHLMNTEVLALARDLVRRIVQQLMEKLAIEVQTPFSGVKDRRTRSRVPIAANFDPKATIRRNLQHYDTRRRQLVIREPLFTGRVRRQSEQWQLIILVDQSGSMADSVIHSAISASIFHRLPLLRTHLVAFDTSVVDLTSEVDDPVEVLMRVQLGGGTDIGAAMRYAEQLVEQPSRTMVVLISDLYEGGDRGVLVGVTARLCESGCRVLALGAMVSDNRAVYDQTMAAALVDVGAKFGVMTPGELATWVAEVVL